MTSDTLTTTEETEDAEVRRQARLLKTAKTGIRKHVKAFRTTQEALTEAALNFREHTSISYQRCRTLVQTLQELRKQTNACLEFFHCGKASPFSRSNSYHYVTNNLERLDGEQTARLILEVDLFGSLVLHGSYDEKLSQARQRIEMHVTLQDRLRKEVKDLKELISYMEQLLTIEIQPCNQV